MALQRPASAPLLLWRNEQHGELRLANGDTVVGDWATLAAQLGPRPVALAVPLERVLVTRLALPGRRRDWRQVARYSLEEWLVDDADEMHVALGHATADGVLVAAVAVAQVHQWLATLQAVGIDPVAMYPDGLLLPPHNGPVADGDGRRWLYWDGETGFAAETATFRRWWAATWPDAAPDGGAQAAVIEDACADATANAPPFVAQLTLGSAPLDLRQGPFAKQSLAAWRPWRGVAALLLLAMAVQLAHNAVQWRQWQQERAQLQADMVALLQAAAPDVQRIVNPRAQLEGLLRTQTAAPAADFVGLLAKAAPALRTASALSLQQLDYQDGQLALQLAGGATADIAALQQALQAVNGLAVTVETRRRNQANDTRLVLAVGETRP